MKICLCGRGKLFKVSLHQGTFVENSAHCAQMFLNIPITCLFAMLKKHCVQYANHVYQYLTTPLAQLHVYFPSVILKRLN